MIKIGGVPEHFNLPWKLAIENRLFSKENITIKWTDFDGGTGAMIHALDKKEIDLALLLTEGAIAGISKGSNYKIIQTYILSPLTWGIYCAGNKDFESINDVSNKTFAISRLGSGSHLMAYVLGKRQNWKLTDLEFIEAQNLAGANKMLHENDANLFMWEKYTTKHLVEKGDFKLVDEIKTPWSCFCLVANNDFILANKNKMKLALDILNPFAKDFKKNKNSVAYIAQRHKLSINDATDFLNQTIWNDKISFDINELKNVATLLSDLNLIHKNLNEQDLIFDKW